MRTAHNFRDMAGQIFFRLKVIELAGKTSAGQWRWRCICDCGAEVFPTTGSLRSGRSKSCGCLSRDRATKHGMYGTSEYIIWQQAKERCHNPRKDSYARYGARGIYMCREWRDSFAAFYADMGARPGPDHTLERVNNDGPYSPDNCVWATKHQQYRNRRQTVWFEIDGVRLCQKDWCKKFGIDPATFAARLRRGWPLEVALRTPPAKQRGRNCLTC